MPRYVMGRLIQSVVVLWAAFTLTFGILYLLPSDAVELQLSAAGVDASTLSPEQFEQIMAQHGLDRPMTEQYFDALTGAMRGDFGTSISQNVPVSELIAARVDGTLQLSLAAGIISLVAGTALAFLAVYVRSEPLRVVLTRLPAIGASLPSFFTALFIMQLLSFQLGWLPATGDEGWRTLVMPSLTIALATSAMVAQVLINSLAQTMALPYIMTARAKGLSRAAVQLKHGLRNAALPAMTILGVIVGMTATASIVVETVFNRDGLGRLVEQAVTAQDVPVVLAVVTYAAALFVLVNLVVDLLYPLLDPRISHASAVRPRRGF